MGSLPQGAEDINLELFLNLGLTEPRIRATEYPVVLTLFSSVLKRIIYKNEQIHGSLKKGEILTVFHGSRAPNIGITSYIERIFKYSKCSPSCFVLAYVYIDRFLLQPDNCLTILTVHRLIITAIAVAAKFIDDAFYNNAYYARIGGISTPEMNRLELNFLFSIDFKLRVGSETFRRYCLQLETDGLDYQIERPICNLKDWKKIEDSNRQPSLQKCI